MNADPTREPLTQADIDAAEHRWAEFEARARRLGADIAASVYGVDRPRPSERTCPHEHSEPVDVRDHTTGATVTVARICTACLTQLPAAWGCTRCEWTEVRRLCDATPERILARPCQEHA